MTSWEKKELEIREQAIAVLAQLAGTDTETLKKRIEEEGFTEVQKQIIDLDKIEIDLAKRICKERGWNYEALKEAEREQRLREAKDREMVRRLAQPVVQSPSEPPATESMIASAIHTSAAL